jgi:hypothetical protein
MNSIRTGPKDGTLPDDAKIIAGSIIKRINKKAFLGAFVNKVNLLSIIKRAI